MNGYLKQATAGQVRTIGPFIDDTDFKTLENALTIANTDIVISINGAADTIKNSGGATAHGAGGIYTLTWDATDTASIGELSFSVKVAGALVVFGTYVVLDELVYDTLFGTVAIATTTNITAGTITTATNVTTVNGLAANVITAAATHADFGTEMATAVWDEDATAHQNAGTFGKAIGDPLAATNSLIQRTPDAVAGAANGLFIAGSNAATTANITGNLTGNVTGSVGSVAAGGITSSSFAAGAINAAALAADAITAAKVAADVTAELQSGLATAASIAALNNLSEANVRTAVGLASANLDTQIDGLPTATETADALLKRDMSAVTGEAARSPLNALRFLRNKFSIAAGTLTVTKEDDATTAWSAAVTTTAGNPVTAIDPT